MKARQPKLKLDHLDIDSTNLRDFILNDCATYSEAAKFFRVEYETVARWMMGTVKPHPACYTAVALYKHMQKESV